MGAMRGNEFQQLYICSLLSKELSELETRGAIVSGKQILLIPSLNYSSFNVGKKYWISDNSDVNRAFPGKSGGTGDQQNSGSGYGSSKRLCVWNTVCKLLYGWRIYPACQNDGDGKAEYQSGQSVRSSLCCPTAEPRAYDKATLNYNWQIGGTEAFSVYSGVTEKIDSESASHAVSAVLRFLTRMGIIRYNCHAGYISTVLDEEELLSVKSDKSGGFLKRFVSPGDEVVRGNVIANVINPMTGEIAADIYAPTDGIIFYAQNAPMIYQNSVVFKLIRRLHN